MSYEVQISARHLHWPKKCACCESVSTTNLNATASKTKGSRTNSYSWEIPYCDACTGHVKTHESSIKWITIGAMIFLSSWILLGLIFKSGTASFIVGITLGSLCLIPYNNNIKEVKKMMKKNCCTLGPAVQYVDWYGTMHKFKFESKEYIELFLSCNNQKTRSDIKIK